MLLLLLGVLGAYAFTEIGPRIDGLWVEKMVEEATDFARKTGRLLLNVGCGSTDYGDVNLDILPQDVRNFVQGDAQDLSMFRDKEFGAVLANHVLEHLDDPDRALAEWNRVAERVFVSVPLWWSIDGYKDQTHKWVFTPYGRGKLR